MDPYYAENTGFAQSRHACGLSLPRAMRSMSRHEMGDRSSSCTGPTSESDGKLRNPQRRRVPVACQRCRRRKIKCSGDSEDGQGCSNCHSAGENLCQFTRVNSQPVDEFNTQMLSDWVQSHRADRPGASGWQPYPNMRPAAAPSQLGVIPTHAQSKPTLLSMGSTQPQTRVNAYQQRSADFDLGAADAHAYQRSGGVSSMHYEDETSSSHPHPSQYILPNTSPGVMMDYGIPAWSPKAWDSMFGTGRHTNGNVYPESDANTSFNQSHFTYMLPSQDHSVGDLSQPNSATMSEGSSDAPGPDRTLPSPTSRGQQGPNSATEFIPTEGNPNLPWSSPDFKAGFWSPRIAASPDHRPSSTHTVPTNTPFTTGPELSNKGISVNGTGSELLFPYLPMPTTSEDTMQSLVSSSTAPPPPISTAGMSPAYPILETLDNTGSDYPSIHNDTRITRNHSRDHGNAGQRLLALNECTPAIYGYSTSEKSKARGSGPDAESHTLLSGLPYTRVQHRDTSSTAFSFNSSPDALPEYHRAVVENVHRPPAVEPLGNQGSY
ncbi:hypothetical protein N7478_009015 [Penicillium angulare]|uniref:uncharacterized protein n=1 Tax=Penicillium angulare TaxID=116970 RepID=UPI002541787B|nr:uncharacterized protein N7478_009015 [Penicillium angulare]KAJ5273890.1 hypothetical protein N7478_009015 [Penicillium angulare]